MNRAESTGGSGVGVPRIDLVVVESLGGELVHTMRTLRDLLASRARALEAARVALETYHDELGAERERLDRRQQSLAESESRLADELQQLESRARDSESLRRELEVKQRELQARLDSLEADRLVLEHRATSISDGERELKAAREALAAREAQLSGAERDAVARRAEAESEWQARLKELAAARESVAILQAQLEAELGKLPYRKTGAPGFNAEGGESSSEGTPGAAAGSRELVERVHKLSRDARRRITGG